MNAADWPQWGGQNQRNMASNEKGLAANFDPGKKRRDYLGYELESAKNVRWIARLGSENYSGPTVAQGRVFIGTNDEDIDDPRFEETRGGVLLCLEEATGKRLWRLVCPMLEIDRTKVSEDFDAMNLGICSTVTVEGDRVYLVSNRCEVLCLDIHGMANGNDGPFKEEASFFVPNDAEPVVLAEHDADIIWRLDMIRDIPVFPHDAANCSILVQGDYLYVGTANGVYDGKVVLPEAPTLIAVKKETGELVARDTSGISARVFHGQWSSPASGVVKGIPQVFYGGGDGICYGFALLTGGLTCPTALEEIWRFDCNPPGYREREGVPIDYWALVRGKSEYFVADANLISPNEIIGTPVFHNNHIYLTIGQDPVHGRGRGAISCINPAGVGDLSTSGNVWQYTGIGRSMSTISAADGLIYAAEREGMVHCLDAETGAPQWCHDTGEEIWSSTLVADGNVYIGTRRGLVILAAGRTEQVLADIKLGTPVWSVPAAANGILYVASQRNLWAVQEKGELAVIDE